MGISLNLALLKQIGFGLSDILDLALVSLLIFFTIRLFRGTRALYILLGIALLFMVAYGASVLRLPALNWLMENLRSVAILALVIIFQPEIRRALGIFGKNPFLRSGYPRSTLDELVRAAQMLKERGLGAIIVIEGRVGIWDLVEEGTRLDAGVSAPLVVSIFAKDSPLHDGAVVVKGDRMVAARVILPLSDVPSGEMPLGTRHRAAIGITEHTDAVCIVVSEEMRTIRGAYGGRLSPPLSAQALRAYLAERLGV